MLACSDGTLYTGWTTDIGRRLKEHNRGAGSRYTRARRPVDLVYVEALPDRSTAMQRERQIKALARRRKVELVRKSNRITKEFIETISQRKG
jgi:putative endonuclease